MRISTPTGSNALTSMSLGTATTAAVLLMHRFLPPTTAFSSVLLSTPTTLLLEVET
jgi:hypothetical protein